MHSFQVGDTVCDTSGRTHTVINVDKDAANVFGRVILIQSTITGVMQRMSVQLLAPITIGNNAVPAWNSYPAPTRTLIPTSSQYLDLKLLASVTKRNDGEFCIHCGRRNKELALATSITRYCPTCEAKTTPEHKIKLDVRAQPMLESDLSIDEWMEEAIKTLGKP